MKIITAFRNWFSQTYITPRKRVQLARDIIAQLDLESLLAISGSFYNAKTKESLQKDPTASGQKVLSNMKCGVCVKGAAVIAYVRRFNHLSCGEIIGGNEGNDWNDFFKRIYTLKVTEVFSATMLAEMEVLYERKVNYDWNMPYLSVSEQRQAFWFSDNNLPHNLTERLKEIMHLLINNRGRKIFLDIKHTNEKRAQAQ